MTEQEAIEVIKKADAYSVEAIEELKTIKDKAIALDKYGEYYSVLQNCLREREACAVAVKALERLVPKKVKEIRKSECIEDIEAYGGDALFGYCPMCDELQSSVWNANTCGDCGQKLDWS